jgi:4-amino-4-deoxy-L-arabinose transferase-like glycosyltransferase
MKIQSLRYFCGRTILKNIIFASAMQKTAPKHHLYLVWFILLLLIPALFINLGISPLIADEATRGMVAFEMQHSGNLITPTINGEHYYNKPPLYNWILLGFFNLFNQYSEFVLRLPAVISLLIFGLIIYYTTRRELGKRVAFLSSLLFITCGRILFYDSMRGLIDLSFSMVIFLNFYLIYYFITRKKYYSLFLISYLLASTGFLMKGLPALVFQALTMVTALAYFKSLKKLFHPSHVAGLMVFILLVGGYYYLLWDNSRNPEFFTRLVTESTKRTLIDNGFWSTIKQLLYFPFDQVYQLLPWSLFFIFLFRKSFYSKLREKKYLGYLALVFVVNIPIYWTSVGTHPRYLFMLYPIILILLVNYYSDLKQKDIFYRAFWIMIFTFSGLGLAFGTWYFLTHSIAESERVLITFCCTLAIVLTAYFLMWKKKDIRIELLIIILLFLRVIFNLVILPDRLANTPQFEELQAVEKINEITKNGELLLHPKTQVTIEFIYYMSTARNEILRKEYGEIKNGIYYIFDERDPLRKGEMKLMEFESRYPKRIVRLSIITEDKDPPVGGE